MTAKLQKGQTIKKIAESFAISERQLYKAKLVHRFPDLAARVEAKELSIHAAWLLATGRSKATSWDRLVTAWNNATDEDRALLLEQIGLPVIAAEIRSEIAIALPDGTANLQSGE